LRTTNGSVRGVGKWCGVMNNNDRKEKDDKAGKPKEGSVSVESHV
jgi:hypothetical protein